MLLHMLVTQVHVDKGQSTRGALGMSQRLCLKTASGITVLLLFLRMVEQIKARYEGAFELVPLCLCWLASRRQVNDAGKLCGSHKERQSKTRKGSFASYKTQVQ